MPRRGPFGSRWIGVREVRFGPPIKTTAGNDSPRFGCFQMRYKVRVASSEEGKDQPDEGRRQPPQRYAHDANRHHGRVGGEARKCLQIAPNAVVDDSVRQVSARAARQVKQGID